MVESDQLKAEIRELREQVRMNSECISNCVIEMKDKVRKYNQQANEQRNEAKAEMLSTKIDLLNELEAGFCDPC